ncbi:MAG: hypothetical protein ACREON_00135 [Gemmatimonadaceae bacterium]
MPKALDADVRRSLVERVAGRVAGSGISRAAVQEAVDRVLSALGSSAEPSARAPLPPEPSTILAVISARSVPDLASRLRRDLERDGVVIEEMGLGAAGQHTVVTLRVAAAARGALERLAGQSRYSLSFLNPPATPA